jgi:hypothetical protein
MEEGNEEGLTAQVVSTTAYLGNVKSLFVRCKISASKSPDLRKGSLCFPHLFCRNVFPKTSARTDWNVQCAPRSAMERRAEEGGTGPTIKIRDFLKPRLFAFLLLLHTHLICQHHVVR